MLQDRGILSLLGDKDKYTEIPAFAEAQHEKSQGKLKPSTEGQDPEWMSPGLTCCSHFPRIYGSGITAPFHTMSFIFSAPASVA